MRLCLLIVELLLTRLELKKKDVSGLESCREGQELN